MIVGARFGGSLARRRGAARLIGTLVGGVPEIVGVALPESAVRQP